MSRSPNDTLERVTCEIGDDRATNAALMPMSIPLSCAVLLQRRSCAAATHTLISQAFSYTNILLHSSYIHIVHFSTRSSRITPPILPPRPPPLLPLPTIKLLLPQLDINRIMRLAHPLPKLAATANARCIDLHPVLEVLGAHPARVQLAERAQERGCLGL